MNLLQLADGLSHTLSSRNAGVVFSGVHQVTSERSTAVVHSTDDEDGRDEACLWALEHDRVVEVAASRNVVC